MSDPKVKQWITDFLNKELGTDPETGEGANVEVLSWKIVECMFNGKSIDVVATAWGESDPFKCRYWDGEWEFENDHMPDPSEVWSDLDRKK